MNTINIFSFDLDKRSSFKLFHIPIIFRKRFNLEKNFKLNIYLNGTLIGSENFSLTSGSEINMPKKYITLLGNKPSGILSFEYPYDELQINNVKNDKKLNKTEKEAVILSRIGQGKFRTELIKLWQGCSVTNEKNTFLLKASHIKPWCISNNFERIDPNNGLLLIPNIDCLFDNGYISFNDHGKLIISSYLNKQSCKILGISNELTLRFVKNDILLYLKYHRKKIFKK